MNYLDTIATQIYFAAHPEATTLGNLSVYRLYALLLLAKGQDVTPEDIHNAWVACTSECNPGHRSIIPFQELTLNVQQLDQKYADAIHIVAAQMKGEAAA